MPELLFPFFIFEIMGPDGTTFAATNKLSHSTSYALGMLRKLRSDATSDLPSERLHLFGAVSSGSIWQIYVAYEVDPAKTDMKCVSLKFE